MTLKFFLRIQIDSNQIELNPVFLSLNRIELKLEQIELNRITLKFDLNRFVRNLSYEGGKGFQYLDLKAILGIYFKKLPSIQKYQHFLFEASNLGTVKFQEVANGPFT